TPPAGRRGVPYEPRGGRRVRRTAPSPAVDAGSGGRGVRRAAPSPAGDTGSGGRRRGVGEDQHAVADGLRIDQTELLLLAWVAEQALAGAEDDREDHQPQLVDEVELDEGLGESRAAVDDYIPVRLVAEPGGFADEV